MNNSITVRNLVVTVLFSVFSVGLALAAIDPGIEVRQMKEAIQSSDFDIAFQHCKNVTDFALSQLINAAPSAEVAPRLVYSPSKSGDTTYLVVMAEELGAAVQAADLIRMRDYSMTLSGAIFREKQRRTPQPGQDLPVLEQRVAGASPIQRFLALPSLAKSAFAAGDLAKATAYSSELLAGSDVHSGDHWPMGEAIHVGNTVAGRVALIHGDVAIAKARLLASGRTTGSPAINSFGPNMALAAELLAHGEKDTVLEYLAECRKFWAMDRGRLDQWSSQIEAGRIPDFGANLRY